MSVQEFAEREIYGAGELRIYDTHTSVRGSAEVAELNNSRIQGAEYLRPGVFMGRQFCENKHVCVQDS